VRRPHGHFVWVTTLSGWIVTINPELNEVVDSLYAGGTLRRIAFDPSGRRAVIADEDGRVIFAH
jgi:DNA-binding beta-propeller fold protein YncE